MINKHLSTQARRRELLRIHRPLVRVPPAGHQGVELRQLDGMHAVALVGGNGHGERDQMEPAADCLVDAAEARLVVAGDDEFESREILEKSCLMNRAATVSPPVSCLMRLSAQRHPSSVSVVVTCAASE